MIDDLGWNQISAKQATMGTYTGSFITPNIEKIADQGLSFTHAYTQPNCAPSRAAMLSGQYPARINNGVYIVGNLNRNRKPGITKEKAQFSGPSQSEDVAPEAVTIAEALKKNGYNVLDVEPPPPGLPENLHQKFGFSMYSARYGNIYTVRQLLQLAQEVAGEWTPQNYIWEKGGKYFDALRPAVEPEGLDSSEEVLIHRMHHISNIKNLFKRFNLFH